MVMWKITPSPSLPICAAQSKQRMSLFCCISSRSSPSQRGNEIQGQAALLLQPDPGLEAACARTEVETQSSWVPGKHLTRLSFLKKCNFFHKPCENHVFKSTPYAQVTTQVFYPCLFIDIFCWYSWHTLSLQTLTWFSPSEHALVSVFCDQHRIRALWTPWTAHGAENHPEL